MMDTVETVIELSLVSNYLSCLDKTRLTHLDEGVFQHYREDLNYGLLETIGVSYDWLAANNLDEETFAEMLDNRALELGVEGINNLCSSYWSAGYRHCYGKYCNILTKENVTGWGYARCYDNKEIINAFWCINCFESNCIDKDGNMFEQPSVEYCYEIEKFRESKEQQLRKMLNTIYE